MEQETHHIAGDSAGTTHTLTFFRFVNQGNGQPGVRLPKIYLQAGLHADEHPGIAILHHLMDMLEVARREKRLHAEFIIAPVVNPLGLTHLAFGQHQGRYHPAIALNYNRQWPDLMTYLEAHPERWLPHLKEDPVHNQHVIRTAIGTCLKEQAPQTALDCVRHAVQMHAYTADMVLDLHCDIEALPHIYTSPDLMPAFQDLSDWMGSAVTMTATDSGGGSFDEVWSTVWTRLRAAYPHHAWPNPVFSATLEYRGLRM